MENKSFAEQVLDAFKNIRREMDARALELDVRMRFVKYFLETVLGYKLREIKQEKNRADLTILDENHFSVIKIETKNPAEDIHKARHERQALQYAEETTRYVILTNFLQLKVWELGRRGPQLRVDLDFEKMRREGKTGETLTAEEKTQILFLERLKKENLFDESKYEKFNEYYARIDIATEAGFRKLIERLNYIANSLLLEYTLKAFGEYQEGYCRYQAELKQIEDALKDNRHNKELAVHIARQKQKIQEKYKKYLSFSGYELWKEYSGKENASEEEAQKVFCKESIYVFLNKLLFLRICEDKKFIPQSISNGGIEKLRKIYQERFEASRLNKEVLETAFKSGSGLYPHFYEVGILDWFRTGDGELDQHLNRVLWILNQFDFAHVDRDILGNLYEKYLSPQERKKLGEFYTPLEVIRHILTSVGYTHNHGIENKEILDPACGSGGFLVEAVRRLISRYLVKFGKIKGAELRNYKKWKRALERLSPEEAKIVLESVQKNIYGLDINPFACHIAEMNLLFQVIDLYQKVRKKWPDYRLRRFEIYRTDSLEKAGQKQLWNYNHAPFFEEQEKIDAIKNKKFDFVVGNPPYVRVQRMEKKTKENIRAEYVTAKEKFDMYIPFIERGLQWLGQRKKLGYITPNSFLTRTYGKALRKMLVEKTTILQIIDFGDSGVFKDATNYPCILLIQNNVPKKTHRFKTVIVKRSRSRPLDCIYKMRKQKRLENQYFSFFEIKQQSLREAPWKLVPKELAKISEKMRKNATCVLGKIAEHIYEGFITGANDVYFVSENKAKALKLERSLLKPVPKGKNVKKWKFSVKQWVIYPYEERNGKTVLVRNMQSQFPNIWRYFKRHEKRLKQRLYLMKAVGKGHRNAWFEIWNPRKYAWFNQPKIITPNLAKENNFAFDEKKVFLDHDCYGIILCNKQRQNYLFFLGVLNSTALEFYLKQISPYASGKYYRYMKGYLQCLPIKLPETAREKKLAARIVKKVDEILALQEETETPGFETWLQGQETRPLHTLPSVSFHIREGACLDKLAMKNNRIYLNETDHVQIKDGGVRNFVFAYLWVAKEKALEGKTLKNLVYGVKVPKNEALLRRIGKTAGEKQRRKVRIKKLEQEINALVYQLYGLTKTEVRLIEESLC